MKTQDQLQEENFQLRQKLAEAISIARQGHYSTFDFISIGRKLDALDSFLEETGIQCQGCEGPCKSNNAIRRRQNTKYVDDERNWVTLCDDCMEVNEAYWKERWADFYSDCM